MGAESLVVFLRALVPGRVKTRLAATVGAEAALALYAAMLDDLAASIPEGMRVIPFSDSEGPTGPFSESRLQHGDDLFARMANAMEAVFAEGAPTVVLVGSDIPVLTGEVISGLFAMLSTHGAVLGPTTDGGYYAIGFRRASFTREAVVRPSAGQDDSRVLRATADALASLGVSVGYGPVLNDVDTDDDLRTVLGESDDACPSLFQAARALGFR